MHEAAERRIVVALTGVVKAGFGVEVLPRKPQVEGEGPEPLRVLVGRGGAKGLGQPGPALGVGGVEHDPWRPQVVGWRGVGPDGRWSW